ncbi:MAG: hypothetical protein AAFX99_02015 [Myxococcota bacterium]
MAAEACPDVMAEYVSIFNGLRSDDSGVRFNTEQKLKGPSTPWLKQFGDAILNRGLGREPTAKDVREREEGGGLRFAGRKVDLSKLSDQALRELLAAMEPEEEDEGGDT